MHYYTCAVTCSCIWASPTVCGPLTAQNAISGSKLPNRHAGASCWHTCSSHRRVRFSHSVRPSSCIRHRWKRLEMDQHTRKAGGKPLEMDSWDEDRGREQEKEWCGNADKRQKYSWVKENKMEGCNREEIVKSGKRQIVQWACFFGWYGSDFIKIHTIAS